MVRTAHPTKINVAFYRSPDETQWNPGIVMATSRIPLRFIRATYYWI